MKPDEIHALAEAVCEGHRPDAAGIARLLAIAPGSVAQRALLAGAVTVRRHFRGDGLRFCSILNAKAGDCSEDCIYCSQARGVETHDYEKHPWLDDADIAAAAADGLAQGAQALSLVAAWRGLRPGRRLEMVCRSIERLAEAGLRPDASLGLIEDLSVAKRLRLAGLAMYHHNLETARSFFPNTCTTHHWEDRVATARFAKAAGLQLCCGGIIGIGEGRAQRAELAEQLCWLEPDVVPLNFITPLPGSASEHLLPLDPDEALITLAAFRFALPEPAIVLAGGKELTMGGRLAEVLDAGIDGVMVGNYLTSCGSDAAWWREQAAARGLRVMTG
jgi:biotin synthase